VEEPFQNPSERMVSKELTIKGIVSRRKKGQPELIMKVIKCVFERFGVSNGFPVLYLNTGSKTIPGALVISKFVTDSNSFWHKCRTG
jgi:hypothetical protein